MLILSKVKTTHFVQRSWFQQFLSRPDALSQRTYLLSLVLCTVGCLWHILGSVVIFQGIHKDKTHFKSFNTFSSYGCYSYSPLWEHVLVMLEWDLK